MPTDQKVGPQEPATALAGSLPPGYELGSYRIMSVIAAGGFGITYLGEHTTLQKKVAIKEHFPRQFAQREGITVRPTATDADVYKWGLSRFLEEARALARFRHSAIVNVEHVLEANGTAYMVLGYEDGRDMGRWLQKIGRPPTQDEMDRIAMPLLEALELVHAEGLLHRDIAPDNIIVRRNVAPVLIDFGSARSSVGAKTHTMFATVKKGFSPPEQYVEDLKGQGPWTDIYSLAATFYRAVTGQTPQESTDRMLDDTCPPAARIAHAGYRPEFLAAIDEAMKVRPKQRPQSMAEWRVLLLAEGAAPTRLARPAPEAPATRRDQPPPAIAPLLTPAPPGPAIPSQSGLLPPPVARRRSGAVAWLAGILLLAAAGGGGGYWWLNFGSPEKVAEREYIAIATSTDPARHDDFAERHKGTQAAAKAKSRANELQRAKRHADAAQAFASRIKTSTDEAEIERFISEHGDAPVVADARARLADVRKQKQAEAESLRQRQTRFQAAATEWARIRATTDETVIERFMTAQADTPVIEDARARLAALRSEIDREWQRLSASQDIGELERFIARYPSTRWRAPAESRVASLRQQRQAATEAERQRQARFQAAATEWARIRATTDEAVIERFLSEQTPDTPSVAEARARLSVLRTEIDREWQRLAATQDIGAIERFIAKYPNSRWRNLADSHLASLRNQRQVSLESERQKEARSVAANAEWARLRTSPDESAIERFIAQYPDLPIVEEARTRLAALQQKRTALLDTERQKAARRQASETEWSRIENTTDPKVLERFIATYGDLPIAQVARTRLASLKSTAPDAAPDDAAWQKSLDDNTIGAWKDYLRAFPRGQHVKDAQERIDQRERAGRVIKTFTGHTRTVLGVAFLPDGRHVVSSSQDNLVKLWDLSQNREQKVFKGHRNLVRGIAISPDGTLIASASSDATIKIWNVASGQEVRTLRGHTDAVRSVAFSRDGKLLLSGSNDQSAKLWDVASGQLVRTYTGHTGGIEGVLFLSDNATLVTGSHDQSIKVWALADGRLIRTLAGHSASVEPLSAATATGHRGVVISGSHDATAILWNALEGRKGHILKGHDGAIWSVALTNDARFALTTGNDLTVRLWDVPSGKELKVFRGHTGPVLAVAFSPDGRFMITGSQDNTLKLWDLTGL